MTTGRWCGPALLDRYDRVRVVRSLAVVAVASLMLFVFGPSVLAAFAGVLLWGAGTGHNTVRTALIAVPCCWLWPP
jgi:predicted MFS family arabinose efflux permease